MIQAFLRDASGKVLQRVVVPTAAVLQKFPLEAGQELVPYTGSGNIEDWDIAPDGTFVPRVFSAADQLATAKTQKRTQINAYRNRLWNGICQTPKGPINCDPISRANLLGAVVAARGVIRPWTMADNSEVNVSIVDLRAMQAAVDTYIDSVQQTAKNLKDTVDAATTIADVNAVNIAAANWAT